MGWLSPEGTTDVGADWLDDHKVYDDNTSSYAKEEDIPQNSWGHFLEVHRVATFDCDKVRFNAKYSAWYIDEIDLDVYYDGGWQHVYEGSFLDATWVEKSLGGTHNLQYARARFKGGFFAPDDAKWYEFDFNEVAAPPTRRIFITHQ